MATSKSASPLSILVVDDEKSNQVLIEEHLKALPEWALEIEFASSGDEALRKLNSRSYDLIFLDYRMPGSDGLEILDKVRQLHPKSAVAMITSAGSEQVAVSAMKKGAMEYMPREDIYRLDLGRLLHHVIERRYLVDQNMELRQVNQMKNDFIANVSHELRTPLSVILGFAETLKGGSLGSLTPEQDKALDSILVRAEELLKTINRILSFREIQRGASPQLALKPLELRGFLTRLTSAPHRDMTRRKISLQLSLPPQEVWASADADQLKEAVENILSNAFKFGPESSAVRLSLSASAAESLIAVSDSGPGIAPEMLPRLFERFAAAEQGATREYQGLGLGLPLAKQIVEQHKGRIWLESKGGAGCTAFIALPLAAGAAAPAAPVAAPKPAAAPGDKKRVLIVEDNPEFVDVLLLFLSALAPGVETLTAASGFEALDKLKGFSPQLIILDLMMPGMDGFEVIERLKKIPETARVPVLLLTGYAQAAEKARALGARDVLVKPFTKDSFLSKVRAVLALDAEKPGGA